MTAGTLGHRAGHALKWSALTTLARFCLQLAAQVALARLLGPGNFGVYGIGMVVLTFVAFVSGSGFSWSLMLLPRVTRDDIRFSFTWQMVVGSLCAVAMFAAAPAIALFFGEPRVESMVRWLSLASLLTAAAAPATCLLQRDLNFRALGLIQLASYAAGYLAVGVPLALAGHGAAALAAACVVQAAVTLVAAFAVRPHPLKPLFSHPQGSATLSTGKAVAITNIVNWLLGNLDRVIIGRVLNAHAVGLYTVAYNLASIPNVLLLGALQPTLLATGAKLQEDLPRMGQMWLLALACVLVLVTPAAVVAALLAHDLVALLYGPAWIESAWLLALLLLCLPAWASWGLSTPVLWNTGRKHYEFLLQLPILALAVPAWWLLAPGGLRSAAIVSALAIVARAVVIVSASLRALQLRWSVLLPLAARGLALSALCGGAVLAGQQLAAPLQLPGAGLAAGGAAALATLALVLAGCPQLVGPQALAALNRLAPGYFGPRPFVPPAAIDGEARP